MMTAQRRGRSSFLSQIPEVPKSAAGPDALSEFFNSVQKVYERVNEVFETVKGGGYNLDVAKATMGQDGGASYWNDKAWDFLKKAKADSQITADEASNLADAVMKPLGDVIGKANAAIIEGGSGLLNIASFWKETAATIASKTTGFFGDKWHQTAKAYRLVSDYVAKGDAYYAGINQAAGSAEAKAAVADYKKNLDEMKAQKAYIEATVVAAGIPLEALQKQSQQEEVALGAEPATGLLATAFTVFGVTVTYLALLKAAVGVIVTVGTILTFIFPHVVTSLLRIGWLLELEKKKAAEQDERLKREASDAAAKKIQANSDKTNAEVARTQSTAAGLAQVANMQAAADALKKQVAEERAKRGLPTPITEQTWVPWVLAIGGGALVAGVIYWYMNYGKSK